MITSNLGSRWTIELNPVSVHFLMASTFCKPYHLVNQFTHLWTYIIRSNSKFVDRHSRVIYTHENAPPWLGMHLQLDSVNSVLVLIDSLRQVVNVDAQRHILSWSSWRMLVDDHLFYEPTKTASTCSGLLANLCAEKGSDAHQVQKNVLHICVNDADGEHTCVHNLRRRESQLPLPGILCMILAYKPIHEGRDCERIWWNTARR